MSNAMTFRVGKTNITIEVEGCTQCGTKYSYDWNQAKTVEIVIGNGKPKLLSIPICGKCMGVPEPTWDDDDDEDEKPKVRKLSRKERREMETEQSRELLIQMWQDRNLASSVLMCAINIWQIVGLLCAARYLWHAGKAQATQSQIAARVATIDQCNAAAQLSLAIGE